MYPLNTGWRTSQVGLYCIRCDLELHNCDHCDMGHALFENLGSLGTGRLLIGAFIPGSSALAQRPPPAHWLGYDASIARLPTVC